MERERERWGERGEKRKRIESEEERNGESKRKNKKELKQSGVFLASRKKPMF